MRLPTQPKSDSLRSFVPGPGGPRQPGRLGAPVIRSGTGCCPRLLEDGLPGRDLRFGTRTDCRGTGAGVIRPFAAYPARIRRKWRPKGLESTYRQPKQSSAALLHG